MNTGRIRVLLVLLRRVRKSNFRVVIASSKKIPFTVTVIPVCRDKFMVVGDKQFDMPTIARKFENLVKCSLESNIVNGTA